VEDNESTGREVVVLMGRGLEERELLLAGGEGRRAWAALELKSVVTPGLVSAPIVVVVTMVKDDDDDDGRFSSFALKSFDKLRSGIVENSSGHSPRDWPLVGSPPRGAFESHSREVMLTSWRRYIQVL
jgi:hypothetical protein